MSSWSNSAVPLKKRRIETAENESNHQQGGVAAKRSFASDDIDVISIPDEESSVSSASLDDDDEDEDAEEMFNFKTGHLEDDSFGTISPTLNTQPSSAVKRSKRKSIPTDRYNDAKYSTKRKVSMSPMDSLARIGRPAAHAGRTTTSFKITRVRSESFDSIATNTKKKTSPKSGGKSKKEKAKSTTTKKRNASTKGPKDGDSNNKAKTSNAKKKPNEMSPKSKSKYVEAVLGSFDEDSDSDDDDLMAFNNPFCKYSNPSVKKESPSSKTLRDANKVPNIEAMKTNNSNQAIADERGFKTKVFKTNQQGENTFKAASHIDNTNQQGENTLKAENQKMPHNDGRPKRATKESIEAKIDSKNLQTNTVVLDKSKKTTTPTGDEATKARPATPGLKQDTVGLSIEKKASNNDIDASVSSNIPVVRRSRKDVIGNHTSNSNELANTVEEIQQTSSLHKSSEKPTGIEGKKCNDGRLISTKTPATQVKHDKAGTNTLDHGVSTAKTHEKKEKGKKTKAKKTNARKSNQPELQRNSGESKQPLESRSSMNTDGATKKSAITNNNTAQDNAKQKMGSPKASTKAGSGMEESKKALAEKRTDNSKVLVSTVVTNNSNLSKSSTCTSSAEKPNLDKKVKAMASGKQATDKQKAAKASITAAVKSKPKKLRYDQQILRHMAMAMKPFTLKTLSQELKTTEQQLNHTLLAMKDKGLVIEKDFTSSKGKCRTLIWYNNDSKAKDAIPIEFSAKKAAQACVEVQLVQKEMKDVENELAAISKLPCNRELSDRLKTEDAEIAELKKRLEAMRGRIKSAKDGPVAVRKPGFRSFKTKPKSAAELARERCPRRLKLRINKMRHEWKTRKDKCKGFLDSLSDALEKKPKDVAKMLDLETDEMANATLPQKYEIDP